MLSPTYMAVRKFGFMDMVSSYATKKMDKGKGRFNLCDMACKE